MDASVPRAFSDRAVALVVARAAASIGLDAAAFTRHSLRAGFATAAARAGKAERDIMRQTGHRSRAMPDRHLRGAGLWNNNAAVASSCRGREDSERAELPQPLDFRERPNSCGWPVRRALLLTGAGLVDEAARSAPS